MAREQSDLLDKAASDSENRLLKRRSYLKMASAAVTTLAAGGTMVQSAAAKTTRTLDIKDGERIDPYLEKISDGEAVSIPKGTYKFSGATISANNWAVIGNGCTFKAQGRSVLRPTGTGWQFGGVNFDISGADIQAFPAGQRWKLHNCAWSGTVSDVNFLVYPQVSAGSTGTIDKCWFGDGDANGRAEFAIKALQGTNGEVQVKRSYFYQTGTYGVMSVNPPANRGIVNYDKCFFKNCYLDCLRIGNNYGKTGYVRNSVLVYDSKSETPAVPRVSTHLTDPGVKSFRGVWAFWGKVVVENCEISNPYGPALVTVKHHGNPQIIARGGNITGSPRAQGNVKIADNVGTNPSKKPPKGCVTSAKDAYLGSTGTPNANKSVSSKNKNTTKSSGPRASPGIQTLKIRGAGQPTNYEFTVKGSLKSGSAHNLQLSETPSGTVVKGQVTKPTDVDTYKLTGSITSFSFARGDADVLVDGKKVNPSTLGK